eukprot:CAMPEP_0202979302 /NCGR_PEP_ID=MMETSP1396-20130829/85490_1 /ASSEMBLY_ACC=CAM_ASM_000872 /TAXON_ID= /ORGANISM="Pseudokeronopsis sp., Strain Brazil" /LENGTH=189 /DNA_ID=CAMNT_0049718665 /DNA_START=302 /DNA_END=871 /DNA_ORIENTATION=-
MAFPQTLEAAECIFQELRIPKVQIELKVYYPKKFEALRHFFCGGQAGFIQSMMKTKEWTDVSGGKTKSKFYKSFDGKYVFKEVKKTDFKMFLDFAPLYFDYLCKSFFHSFPCALIKILGAFKFKIHHERTGKVTKKYVYVMENLNFGIPAEKEDKFIVRYDLKGSSLNRFIKNTYNGKLVQHDNNFLYN